MTLLQRIVQEPKLLILISAALLLTVLVWITRPVDLNPQVHQAEASASAILQAYGIDLEKDLVGESAQAQQAGRWRWRFLEQRFRVVGGWDGEAFHHALDETLRPHRLSVRKAWRTRHDGLWQWAVEVGPAQGSFRLLYRLIQEEEAPRPAPAAPMVFPKGSGKIAIVLDDWGYNLRHTPWLASVARPLTIAVLPHLSFSAKVAQQADAHGHEVILHMPMESLNAQAVREPSILMTGIEPSENLNALSAALDSVPHAQGISNHQGSKATADRALMTVVLGEVHRRGLYFLDSLVTQQSVCRGVAEELAVPFVRRSIFLDNEQNPKAIRKQMTQLARMAAKHGQAIGLGHDRPVTVAFLKQALPALEAAGYTLVPVSRLLEGDEPSMRDGR